MKNNLKLSIIIPAKNEERSLKTLLPLIRKLYPDEEVIVINDGSNDDTSNTSKQLGALVIDHPYSLGNGAAIKSGARLASGNILVTMDGDGQHDPNDIERLLEMITQGYDMAVGARTSISHSGKRRLVGNITYNYLASLVVGHKIHDLTSGFRAVTKEKFNQFLYLLPNGFSYPTTITMAFFRNSYTVKYVSIHAKKRTGKSHIKLFRDGFKFFIIILKITALYSPLKVFTPTSIIFMTAAILNYAYTYVRYGSFTNMSVLLGIIATIVFLMGLLSEQITTLLYSNTSKNN